MILEHPNQADWQLFPGSKSFTLEIGHPPQDGAYVEILLEPEGQFADGLYLAMFENVTDRITRNQFYSLLQRLVKKMEETGRSKLYAAPLEDESGAARFLDEHREAKQVVDDDGHLISVITLDKLRKILARLSR